MRQFSVALGTPQRANSFVIFIESFVTAGHRLAAQPKGAADTRRTLVLAGPISAVPSGMALAVSDGNEAGRAQRRAGFALLGVGDHPPRPEFATHAPHGSVECRVGIAGAVGAGPTHFEGVSAVVERSSNGTADDGDANEILGALDPDAD